MGLGPAGDAVHEMTPSELWHRIQELIKAQADTLIERSELLSRIDDIKYQNEQLKNELDEKEKQIRSLTSDLQDMVSSYLISPKQITSFLTVYGFQESGKVSTEKQVVIISNLQEENVTLQHALKDIVHRITWDLDQDRDQDEGDGRTAAPVFMDRDLRHV